MRTAFIGFLIALVTGVVAAQGTGSISGIVTIDGKPIAGMSFFMVLPGVGDPVDRFDTMLEIARSLAYKLDAELLDDSGSSWSIQRERYIREELISYRLQWSPS